MWCAVLYCTVLNSLSLFLASCRMVEDLFLRRLVADEGALEPLARLCTAVNVWHMHSEMSLPGPMKYVPGRGMLPCGPPRPVWYPFSWALPAALPERTFRPARDPPQAEAFWSFIVNGSASFPAGWDTSNPAAYGYTITIAPRKALQGPPALCGTCPAAGMPVGQGAKEGRQRAGETGQGAEGGSQDPGEGKGEKGRVGERSVGAERSDLGGDLLLVVTTTFERAYQAVYLSRLAHVLLSVPGPLLWIVVQQGKKVREHAVTVSGPTM